MLTDLLRELDRIEANVHQELETLGEPPKTASAIPKAAPIVRTASTALIKDFEQFEDTLVRAIRTLLRMTGYRLKGMTPFDVANKAEELELVENARRWQELIKLRNELAHEYPDDAEVRFMRFVGVLAGFAFLSDASRRVHLFTRTRLEKFDD